MQTLHYDELWSSIVDHRHLSHLRLPLLQGPFDVRLNSGDLEKFISARQDYLSEAGSQLRKKWDFIPLHFMDKLIPLHFMDKSAKKKPAW